jgi:hypothetical protein
MQHDEATTSTQFMSGLSGTVTGLFLWSFFRKREVRSVFDAQFS